MKNNVKQSTNITSRTSLKIKLTWIVAGFAFLSLIMFGLFIYFYAGHPFQSKGGPSSYSTVTGGNWTSASTWGGSPPPTESGENINIYVNEGHGVTRIGDLNLRNNASITINTGSSLVVDGNVTVEDNFELSVNGSLTISGNLVALNTATVVINEGGNVDVAGNSSFGDLADFTINGTLNIGQNITFGSHAEFIGSGDIELGGLGCHYYGGEGSCAENMILPVELIGFEAKKGNDHVQLKWKTSSELNNDYFSVQKSKDGINFVTIEEIEGKGTTKETSVYQFTDLYPFSGTSYYRLVQVDMDGSSETFRPVSVDFADRTDGSLSIYPNPLSGGNLFISLDKAYEGNIRIQDLNGKVVYNQQVLPLNGNNLELSLQNNLEKGIYFVYYKTKAFEKSVKLVKL